MAKRHHADNEILKGLNIPQSFEDSSSELLLNTISSSNTVSEALIDIAKQIKFDEFGEDNPEISVYEKKLLWAGLSTGQMIMNAIDQNLLQLEHDE